MTESKQFTFTPEEQNLLARVLCGEAEAQDAMLDPEGDPAEQRAIEADLDVIYALRQRLATGHCACSVYLDSLNPDKPKP